MHQRLRKNQGGGKYAPNRLRQRVKKFLLRLPLAALAALALAPLARAQDVFLAPGKSIVILDAADPTVRVVLSAPKDAPLNLSSILVTDPNESVYSIVTRMQLSASAGLARNADGSLELAAPAAPSAAPARMLQGGVLIFTAGKYVYHPVAEAPPRAAAAPAAPARPGSGRLLISKPGATRAQAERDIAQCRRYAEGAAAQFLRSAEKVTMYNTAMHSCLKSFGYEIHAPAA
jgi:hypothetical protein